MTEEFIDSCREGEVISGELKIARNVQFHKKLFALFHMAYDNRDAEDLDAPEARDFEVFWKETLILSGHYQKFYNEDGKLSIQPKSISFENMEEYQFKKLYKDVFNTIKVHHLPHWADEDLVKGALEFESRW